MNPVHARPGRAGRPRSRNAGRARRPGRRRISPGAGVRLLLAAAPGALAGWPVDDVPFDAWVPAPAPAHRVRRAGAWPPPRPWGHVPPSVAAFQPATGGLSPPVSDRATMLLVVGLLAATVVLAFVSGVFMHVAQRLTQSLGTRGPPGGPGHTGPMGIDDAARAARAVPDAPPGGPPRPAAVQRAVVHPDGQIALAQRLPPVPPRPVAPPAAAASRP